MTSTIHLHDKGPSTPASPSNENRVEDQRQEPHQQESTPSKAWRHLNENVRSSFLAELELLLLTFCIGVQDAVSFPDFHCFTSNQTGNTVFLVLAIVLPNARDGGGGGGGAMFDTANVGVALGFFLAAAWLTGQLGHIVGPRRRAWLLLCNLAQTALVFGAAGVQYLQLRDRSGPEVGGDGLQGAEESAPGTSSTLWAIGLLATAAGSQVVQSRSLRMTEISTAMATAAWVDLVIDPGLFALRNRPRNRRAGFLGALVLGTLAGAFVFKTVGSPAALVVSGAGKLLVTIMFLFNPAEKPKDVMTGESA